MAINFNTLNNEQKEAVNYFAKAEAIEKVKRSLPKYGGNIYRLDEKNPAIPREHETALRRLVGGDCTINDINTMVQDYEAILKKEGLDYKFKEKSGPEI